MKRLIIDFEEGIDDICTISAIGSSLEDDKLITLVETYGIVLDSDIQTYVVGLNNRLERAE